MTTPKSSEHDFDQLSAEAYAADAGIEKKNALWKAVFELAEWHFIARGEFPDVTPYVARNEAVGKGEFMLKAFTEPAKLQAFAEANSLTDEEGKVLFLSLSVPGFVDTAEQYIGMGVFGIHFNADAASTGFFAPLESLPAIRDFIKKNG